MGRARVAAAALALGVSWQVLLTAPGAEAVDLDATNNILTMVWKQTTQGLLTVDLDNIVIDWDVMLGMPRMQYNSPDDLDVDTIAYDGNALVYGCGPKGFYVVDIINQRVVSKTDVEPGRVYCAFAQAGDKVLIQEGRTVTLYESAFSMPGMRPPAVWEVTSKYPEDPPVVRVRDDGNAVVLGGTKGEVTLYRPDPFPGQAAEVLLRGPSPAGDGVVGAAFCPQGLMVLFSDGRLVTYDLDSGAEVAAVDFMTGVGEGHFGRACGLVAYTPEPSTGKLLRIAESIDGQEVEYLEFTSPVTAFALSPDEIYIAVALADFVDVSLITPDVTDAPPTPEPMTNTPLTDAPLSDAPRTDAPLSDAPPTPMPTTDAPPTPEPMTGTPPTPEPPTPLPPTPEPTTDAPATGTPAATDVPGRNTTAPATATPQGTAAPQTQVPPAGPPMGTVTCATGMGGVGGRCTVEYLEDGSSAPTAPVGGAEVTLRSSMDVIEEDAATTDCLCTVGCDAALVAERRLNITVPPDYTGDVNVACTFSVAGGGGSGQVDLVFTGVIAAVNDIPVYEAALSTTTITSVVLDGAMREREVPGWVTGISPGPATAVDEIGQRLDPLSEICEVTDATGRGVTDGTAVRLEFVDRMVGGAMPKQDATLTYTLPTREDARAAAGGAAITAREYTVACRLVDSDGAGTQLPTFALKVAFATPAVTIAGAGVGAADAGGGTPFEVASADISAADGTTLRVAWPGAPAMAPAGAAVEVEVVALGGSSATIATPAPRVVVESPSVLAQQFRNLASRAAADPTAAPPITARVDDGVLLIVFQHSEYFARSPDDEEIVVTYQPGFANVSQTEAARMCAPEDAKGAGPCEVAITIKSEAPKLSETVTTTREAVASAMVATSAIVGAGSGTGGASVARVTIASTIVTCPIDAGEKLDRSLNPLGLEVAGGTFPDRNGAVVGTVVLLIVLLSVVCVLRFVFQRKLLKERGVASPTARLDLVDPREDPEYVFYKARFGWLLMPLTFLYAGSSIGAFGTLLYNDVPFKILAIAVLLGFGVGLPGYAVYVARRVTSCAEYNDNVPDDARTCWTHLLWGKREWAWNPSSKFNRSWCDLHDLAFSGYRKKQKFFLVYELVLTYLAGMAMGWQPKTYNECWARGLAVTIIMSIFTLLLLLTRPYIALYENIMETVVGLIEVVMGVLSLLALGEPNPMDSWEGDLCNTLGLACMYLVFIKFAIDTVIFFIDQYSAWKEGREAQGRGATRLGFILYWFCFIGVLDDKYTYYGGDGGTADEYGMYTRGLSVDDSSEEASATALTAIIDHGDGSGPAGRVQPLRAADLQPPSPGLVPTGRTPSGGVGYSPVLPARQVSTGGQATPGSDRSMLVGHHSTPAHVASAPPYAAGGNSFGANNTADVPPVPVGYTRGGPGVRAQRMPLVMSPSRHRDTAMPSLILVSPTQRSGSQVYEV